MELYDFRIYIGEPLSAKNVLALAHSPTYPIQEFYKCAPVLFKKILDSSWENGYGQNCQWLFENKAQYPGKPTWLDLVASLDEYQLE